MILLHPLYILFAIPLLLILIWLLQKDIVSTKYLKPEEIARRNKSRFLLLVTRSLLILCIIVAIAHPVLEKERFEETDPEIVVVIDNSSSMSLLNTQAIDDMLAQLQEKVPVRVRTIGQEESSALGDDILSLLSDSQNILLVTDGQVTSGASLQDVSSFAGTINATINAVRLTPSKQDAAISIDGPNKAVEGNNVSLEVLVSSTQGGSHSARITVDGVELYADKIDEKGYSWQQSFSEGNHVIVAELLDKDTILENNKFIKTITAVPKPHVLFVTQKPSGMEKIVSSLYKADVQPRIPADISSYYAIILNDVSPSAIPDTSALTSYVLSGNGLFVVGGENSYDYGRYKNNVIETLLPVRVGAGERTKGGANIVVAIDMSGSARGSVSYEATGSGSDYRVVEVQGTKEVLTLQKSLAADLVGQLNPSNSVGVLGFTYPQPYSPYGCSGACVIQDITLLGKNKQEVVDKIARVNLSGGTSFSTGMQGAFEMLRTVSGSKNVIFISDGQGSSSTDQLQAIEVAKTIAAQGGRVYTVQVGDNPTGSAYLQQLAAAGNGIYFKATQSNRLSVLFGDPVTIEQGDAFDIFALNEHHFITSDLELTTTLYGYNQVIPKPGSQLLVTTTGGDPVLTVWNFGIGRTASLTAFNGKDLGGLLRAPDSKLLSRTINWLIGDPQRLEDVVVDVSDARVRQEVTVSAHSQSIPQSDELQFFPVGGGAYTARFTAPEQGLHEIIGVPYAVNYPIEWQSVGFSSHLENDLLVSGGSVFEPSNVDGIIEHVKTLQQLRRIDHVDIRWIFILSALSVLLLEIFFRRLAVFKRK